MRLTISTGSYMNELMDWIAQNNYNNYIENFEIENDNCFITLNAPRNFTSNIITLFERIILERNQVAKVHDRLKELLANIVIGPSKKDIIHLINKYILESDHINLEGFVTFRLSDYSHMIDLVLYQAVKNALMSP
ncbi:MAG: putative sporulation protein YtxC [Defluviitaleaceae bacterium]|nr:putative sporulation protein YtxC [Defluviitaleaceae bacterium]